MRRHGFTLLEVLLAVFVLATTMGTLLAFMSDNLRSLSRAHLDAEAMGRAEERLREIAGQARLGELPKLGVEQGVFEEPYDAMHWELEVALHPLALAEPSEERIATSSIFALAGGAQDAPQPSVLRVVMRVFHEQDGPEDAQPLVLFLVEPTLEPSGREAQAPAPNLPAAEAAR